MIWYFNLLTHKPYVILASITLFSIICIFISLHYKLPDFTDPTMGFQTRGTVLADRRIALQNLMNEVKTNGKLVAEPPVEMIPKLKPKIAKSRKKHKKNKKNKLLSLSKANDSLINQTDDDRWEYGKNLTFLQDDEQMGRQYISNKWKMLRELNPPVFDGHQFRSANFFCDSTPRAEYIHFVVERVNFNTNRSLFELDALMAMCDLENKFSDNIYFKKLCETEPKSKICCNSWSLPNYIAVLSNRKSCFYITEEDILNVKLLIIDCYEYYENFKLHNECATVNCDVPLKCTHHNAIYYIIHYLIDINFMNENATNIFVKSSMIFIPIARGTMSLNLYHNMNLETSSENIVRIVAMDMGLKNALFDEYVISDCWLIGLGATFVFICTWIYIKSLFVTIMTIIEIVFSLFISYLVYTVIFGIAFFPFMNMLAIVVLVGIGADGTFIFKSIWNCTVTEKLKLLTHSSESSKQSRTELIATAWKHGALSMFVTSVTTAVAFYSSAISSITAIKCFGLFAGTSVCIYYVLLITWLPASICMGEKIAFTCSRFYEIFYCNNFFIKANKFVNYLGNAILMTIEHFSIMCIVLLGTLGIFSGVVVFYYPSLSLPKSEAFKLFDNDHLFEVFDEQYNSKFFFQRHNVDIDEFKLPLRFVWGIEAIDNGDYLNPTSTGILSFDNTFNISSQESQLWLLDFCTNLKNMSFYRFPYKFTIPTLNCFIENFIVAMDRSCIDVISGTDRTPCCNVSTFPYSPDIFDKCLPQIIRLYYDSPRYIFSPSVAGPKFAINYLTNTSKAVIKTIVIEYESIQSYTNSFSEMDTFTNTIENWFNEQLKTAPIGMKNGWFISDFEFYDLQSTLAKNSLASILLATILCFVVLFLITRNLLISFYSILTVMFSILVTVAILIFMGWKLNILESISISTAIGLCVDYSLHYGIHYRLSCIKDRISSTKFALNRILIPSFMAALTTGAAGGLMLPSSILAYKQIGLFILITMIISWIYATFFLMSLLITIGPEKNCGQFSFDKCRRTANVSEQIDQDSDLFNDRIYAQANVSEQLISATNSTAAGSTLSETHEMISFTPNSVYKSIQQLDITPINFDRAFHIENLADTEKQCIN